jgi:hypothetical protein
MSSAISAFVRNGTDSYTARRRFLAIMFQRRDTG